MPGMMLELRLDMALNTLSHRTMTWSANTKKPRVSSCKPVVLRFSLVIKAVRSGSIIFIRWIKVAIRERNPSPR